MRNSEQVKELLGALLAAQAAMPNPTKNAKNDHFRNRYADLGAVLECLEGPLQQNGLIVTQSVRDGFLVTRLWHAATGQWLESEHALKPEKDTPQGMGSAITYMRRYALKSLFAMADVDDDGNAASAVKSKPAEKPKPAPVEPIGGPSADRQPFDLVEYAMSASTAVRDKDALALWAARVAASKFRGEDHKLVADRYKELTASLAGAS